MWGALIGAGIGMLAGSQKDQTSSTSNVNVGKATELENLGTNTATTNLNTLTNLVGQGPGASDVAAGTQSSRDLAAMLQQYGQTGGIPTAADTSAANQYASTVFQPQQLALQQSFDEQNTRARQLASQLGRPVNDPIIQARLAQEQMRQGSQLTAQQASYGAQFAQNLSQQRLGYAAQLADVNNSLASQAMANRQALLSIGSQLQSNERNWRLGTASRTQTGESGGGLKGAIMGGLAGAGVGMSVAGMLGGGAAAAAGAPAAGGAAASGGGYLGANTSFGMPSFASSFTPSAPAFAAAPMAAASIPSSAPGGPYPLAQSYNMPAFNQQPANPWNFQFNPSNFGGVPFSR